MPAKNVARISAVPARPAAKTRPKRRGGPRPGADPEETRRAIFAAAAEPFSRRGFDGVVVDDIARAARVNKAMIYYHFDDKLGLYREIVQDMLREAGDADDGDRRRRRIARRAGSRASSPSSSRSPTAVRTFRR